ncbi:8-amino-7-oxononanoate synthase [Streptomyces sp. ST2-7A]|uniref:8-amino-7-oxononanoate synthase n=1 Tax=Streptomyces sp. ST2-7A TaxID=2907214 RepID=UPI001F1A4FA8|nr:8-amino-7-oxononanoate synthase [Streptomyces sp. ST2-7A]MCE7079063.1 8-amino-7-oxononanoate synthase [Streptomyces sp. ST2-7A]
MRTPTRQAPGDRPPEDPFGWLDAARAERERAGLTRTPRPREAGEGLLDLAGNDYLGLARHPRVTSAAADAAHRWGAGATGSRLVTGTTVLHTELEVELAAFCGFEAGLVFSSGYAANLAALTALAGPTGKRGAAGLIVSDAANHASLIDGCRLARAATVVAPHADPAAVDKILNDRPPPAGESSGTPSGGAGGQSAGPVLVVTDSVFSVDGDAAPLTGLADVCREHGAALVVDDAHGLGVVGDGGRGAPHTAGLAGAADVVATVTLSKSLGSQGGAVLGPARVIEHLVNAARTFIFDTGLAPAAAGGALEALRTLRSGPERPARARWVAGELHRRLTDAGHTAARPDAAVVSVHAPDPVAAVRWAADCREAGVAVGCFRPPSVPDGISRLRLTARADLSDADLDRATGVILATAPGR